MALTINKCCCISLPTACIIIGVLGGVFSLLKSIECFTHLYLLKETEEVDGFYDKFRIGKTFPRINLLFVSLMVVTFGLFFIKFYIEDIYYVLVPNIVYVITSFLLIIGIRKNSHLMLLPWLIINVIVLLLSVPIVLFYFYYAGLRGTTKDLLQIIAIICLFLGVSCWIWIAVYSLFQDIRTKRNEELPENEKTLMNLYPRYEIVQLDV